MGLGGVNRPPNDEGHLRERGWPFSLELSSLGWGGVATALRDRCRRYWTSGIWNMSQAGVWLLLVAGWFQR
jgi:hypothetical protein